MLAHAMRHYKQEARRNRRTPALCSEGNAVAFTKMDMLFRDLRHLSSIFQVAIPSSESLIFSGAGRALSNDNQD
jgi:hypothetical protein